MKRQMFHLREDQVKELEARKDERGISKSEVIRRALDEHFRKHHRDGQDVLV